MTGKSRSDSAAEPRTCLDRCDLAQGRSLFVYGGPGMRTPFRAGITVLALTCGSLLGVVGYVCAESAGAKPLIANRGAIGPWEKFVLG